MPHRRLLQVLVLALIASLPGIATAADCSATSKGFVPLIDLGAGLYQGFPGGLYGAGSNARPNAHEAAGVAIAHAIVPLDTLGSPDPNGRIVVISIGMSNCTQEFSAFVQRTNVDAQKNPRVKAIDCALGGWSADRIKDPAAAYWDSVEARLRRQGSTPLQPQVVWIKEANASPKGGFPASADSLLWNLGSIVRNIKSKLPNVKLVYLTSRIYAGYASSALNPEPYSYESGFAVKWLLDAQIAGEDSLNWDPNAGPTHAPWMSWGPYLWADGLTPRSDGLTWACSEFVSTDGTHPSETGRAKVADSLLAFFQHDVTTAPWYVKATTSVPAPLVRALALAIAPDPTPGEIRISFALAEGRAWRLELLDLSGRRVAELGHGRGAGRMESVAADLRSAGKPGVYWLRLSDSGGTLAQQRVVLRP